MRCPICKKSVSDATPGAESPKYFPFCSERCKLIDLGNWISTGYRIPVKNADEDEDGEPLPPRKDTEKE
jgi:endogenous inhibitor of DNA gyrase (YacG/DUF329 family)